MIDSKRLLGDLQDLLTMLEDDLRERCTEDPAVDQRAQAEFQRAREAQRTAQAYEVWRDEWITQVAVAYLLACVFVRFLEDNELVPEARLAGVGARNAQAKDRHTVYFQEHPRDTELGYLHSVFREVGQLPGATALFDEKKNPLWKLELSPDGARLLVEFWRKLDPDSGQLAHDFTDPTWGTRFLGDLYQDLSEAARTKYALLQTPEFVEEFILDRTLDPALAEFGHKVVRLIDPACGSGHFLLGAFARILKHWQDSEPGTNPRELVQRTLDAVCGVDLNPFAAAIARFRLLLAALRASGITRLRDAPAFRISVAAGDSLLHGPWPGTGGSQQTLVGEDPLAHVYEVEDKDELRRLLGRRYHAVVGNPPYISPSDPGMAVWYRRRYRHCQGEAALVVPFVERFFELAVPSAPGESSGLVGMIAANHFSRRRFGKKLVEEFLPTRDVTHVVDTSGVRIPGHEGSPTVILFARNRPRTSSCVRILRAKMQEPSVNVSDRLGKTASGPAWQAILDQVDRAGSETEWISSDDVDHSSLQRHPWSMIGMGPGDLKMLLEDSSQARLKTIVTASGFLGMTHADPAFLAPAAAFFRKGVESSTYREVVQGKAVRNWRATPVASAIFPYDNGQLLEIAKFPGLHKWLWPMRTFLGSRATFSKQSYAESGRPWWSWHQVSHARMRENDFATWAFTATHNHFARQVPGRVFTQTAPIFTFKPTVSVKERQGIVACLNSSIACAWGRATFLPRGGFSAGKWEERLDWDCSQIKTFPLPDKEFPFALGQALESATDLLQMHLPSTLLKRGVPRRDELDVSRTQYQRLQATRISLQEELDWHSYFAYGLLGDDLSLTATQAPPIALGQRAFEIVMARRMAAGELATAWFERHGSTASTEIPLHWPPAYRTLVEQRIAVIEANSSIRLIEQPEYKRRWNDEPWEKQQERALRSWLLDRVEAPQFWSTNKPVSCARLADRLRDDLEFMQVAALYRGHPDFDVTNLMVELAEAEAVPYWAPLRYTPAGLRKRQVWERTWKLQRREDSGDKSVGKIAPPPKYAASDFLKTTTWRLRDELDVPKERFTAYPGAERGADTTPVIGWAGWDHLQQAQALAAHYLEALELESWPVERLLPLLAGLLELVPWLKQWHNDLDPTTGERMGDYFESFVAEHARRHGTTLDGLRDLQPIAPAKKPRRTKKATT
jgi:hypothetical protein